MLGDWSQRLQAAAAALKGGKPDHVTPDEIDQRLDRRRNGSQSRAVRWASQKAVKHFDKVVRRRIGKGADDPLADPIRLIGYDTWEPFTEGFNALTIGMRGRLKRLLESEEGKAELVRAVRKALPEYDITPAESSSYSWVELRVQVSRKETPVTEEIAGNARGPTAEADTGIDDEDSPDVPAAPAKAEPTRPDATEQMREV